MFGIEGNPQTCSATGVGFKLLALLLGAFIFWDYKHVPPHPVLSVIFNREILIKLFPMQFVYIQGLCLTIWHVLLSVCTLKVLTAKGNS